MNATALYVELIVIGLEVSLWITSFFVYFTDVKNLSVIVEVLGKIPASVFLLGIMYILGLLFDRLADALFSPLENCRRSKAGVQVSSTILVWTKSGQEGYLKFSRSKLRILRASILNFPLFFVSLLMNIASNCGNGSAVFHFSMTVGITLFVAAALGYWNTVNSFYQKAAILEKALS